MEASISKQSALEHWLDEDPAATVGDEARELWQHVVAFHDAIEANEPRRLEWLGLLCDRALDIDGRLRGALLEAKLPLPEDVRAALVAVVGASVRLAQVGQRLGSIRADNGDEFPGRMLPQALAMAMIRVAGVLSAMGGLSPPFNLWAMAHALARGTTSSSGRGEGGDKLSQDIDRAYKCLLALAVIQPEGFTPAELQWLADFLERFASEVRLVPLDGEAGEGFWIDVDQDAPPVAITRRPPPVVDGVLKMDARALAARASDGLTRLRGVPEEKVTNVFDAVTALTVGADLPEGLTVGDAMGVLDRVARRWSAAPLRERPRRWQHQPVAVCFGLAAIWERLGAAQAAIAPVEEWVIVNESIGGYAIQGQGNAASGLAAGMAVGVRLAASGGWTVCIVRWLRAEDPAHVELGLQVVADGAAPVRLGFRGGELREMVPGLMLSPRVGMRSLSGMLVPAGTSVGRRFVFVRDGTPIYVGQGLLVSVEIRTATSELFQFELDPIPE
ncbi:MAG: hypothetical protein JNJ44_04685 [Zoogloeaceae bacterium]|nr:hypothetical protein [Zoogloeaceae bacterium]